MEGVVACGTTSAAVAGKGFDVVVGFEVSALQVRTARWKKERKKNLTVMVRWERGTLCIQPSGFHASARV